MDNSGRKAKGQKKEKENKKEKAEQVDSGQSIEGLGCQNQTLYFSCKHRGTNHSKMFEQLKSDCWCLPLERRPLKKN